MLEPIIESDELSQNNVSENNNIGQNWDDENNETLNNWIKECSRQQYIYDYVLDRIITKSKRIKIILLILSSIQSLVSVADLGFSDNVYQIPTWIIKSIIAIISILTVIFTQYLSLEKIEENIKRYTTYTNFIDDFLSDLIPTANIKIALRPDGNKYILEQKEIYEKIQKDSPYVIQSYWNDGLAEYHKYILGISDAHYARKRKIYDNCTINARHLTLMEESTNDNNKSVSVHQNEECTDDVVNNV